MTSSYICGIYFLFDLYVFPTYKDIQGGETFPTDEGMRVPGWLSDWHVSPIDAADALLHLVTLSKMYGLLV